MQEDDRDPFEDLIHMVQILMEEPDKLEKVLNFGAKVNRNYFIFTCLGECRDVYAVNSVNGSVYHLLALENIPEEGEIVTDTEEIVCVIQSLLDFVQNTPDICDKEEFFMERLNPGNYVPGSCFSPC